MKRICGYVVSLAAVAGLAGSVLPACSTNDQTIFIRSLLAPSANRQGGSCSYNNDPSQPALFSAVLDLGLTDSYTGTFLVGNQLIPRGDPNSNRAESNRVHINGAIVKVQDPNGSTIREFTSLATGFADPQNNNAPGYAPIGAVVFDAPTKEIVLPSVAMKGTARTLLIVVKVFGTSVGGEDVESGEFQFPMQVCRGCLVRQDGDDGKDAPKINCNQLPETTATPSTSDPCYPGQDLLTSCKNCKGNPVCDPTQP